MTRAKVNLDNCVSAIETFCDHHPGHIPVRANSYEAGKLMVDYLTEHEYLDDYCEDELMDMAFICLVESATA